MPELPRSVECGTLSRLGSIQNFFFDLDGTLADSATGLAGSIHHAFLAAGRTMPVKDVTSFIGPGIRTILANIDPTLTPEQIDRMECSFRTDYDGEGVLRTELFEGTAEVLAALRDAGAKLFVITNKPSLATGRLLNKHGLHSMFEAVVSRNSRIPAFASKAEMLRTTMTAHGADPAASVMVGDTAEDAEAAREVGMAFAHASYGYGKCNGADIMLRCIGDLLLHLERPVPASSSLAASGA